MTLRTSAKGVMFDFSQTLFRIRDARFWLRQVLEAARIELPDEELAVYAERLEHAGALPGGPSPARLPERLRRLWSERDLDAERHRATYIGLTHEAALPWPGLADALYDQHVDPGMWQPYPDAFEVLGELRSRGVPVAVVSNIGWDLRPVFREHGLDPLVDVYALSFEHGVQKPDPELFRIACEGLGLAPENVVMVGDDRSADAGAGALGCRVHLVDPLPVEQRPGALRDVLRMAG